MHITTLLTGGLIPVVFAVPTANYRLHDQRVIVHSRYIKTQTASSSVFVPARIAIKQENIAKAEAILHEM